VTRRVFLRIGLAGLGSVCLPAKILGQLRRPNTKIDIILPKDMRTTNVSDFYVQNVDKVPKVRKKNWRLSVRDSHHEAIFDFMAIQKFPVLRRMLTFGCIGNSNGAGQIGNAWWTGCLLSDVLEEAKAINEGMVAKFLCHDIYSTSMPVKDLVDTKAMIVYAMNDKKLNAKHGFPARIVIPGRYGMKNAKWIREIVLTKDGRGGFWEDIGWSEIAVMKLTTHIFPNLTGSRLSGVAIDGSHGITKVEVSMDGGISWHEADLTQTEDPRIWTLWSVPMMDKGRFEVIARAENEAGVLQDPEDTNPFPGGSGAPDRKRFHVK